MKNIDKNENLEFLKGINKNPTESVLKKYAINAL